MASGLFFIEGPRALNQIYSSHPESIQEILIDEAAGQQHSFGCDTRKLTHRQFAQIAPSKTPQGILGVATIPADSYSPKLPHSCGNTVLLLEAVQDPGNVGTLIRSAAAFDFSGVLMSETSADPFSPKAVQASAGSILSVWVRRTKEYHTMATALRERGYSLIAADSKGSETIYALAKKKCVLILGNEGTGISRALRDKADVVFRIPYNAKRAESLNVASAGSIGMFLITGKSTNNST